MHLLRTLLLSMLVEIRMSLIREKPTNSLPRIIPKLNHHILATFLGRQARSSFDPNTTLNVTPYPAIAAVAMSVPNRAQTTATTPTLGPTG